MHTTMCSSNTGDWRETAWIAERLKQASGPKSAKYPTYRFKRSNLEDRQAIQALFEKEKFDTVCNLAAQAGVRYSL